MEESEDDQNALFLRRVQEKIELLRTLFETNLLGSLQDRIEFGSVYLFVRISFREELENLWKMYKNDELKEEITNILYPSTCHAAPENVNVCIDDEEYFRSMEAFGQQGKMFTCFVYQVSTIS